MTKPCVRHRATSAATPSRTSIHYWKNRLLLRRCSFPGSGGSESDFAAYIDHGDVGFFFPLGTSDSNRAAGKALTIYQEAVKEGWKCVCRHFSRELIIAWEWSSNPVLWTYTTIHTVVGKVSGERACIGGSREAAQCILLVESDAGIREALRWSINQHAGIICRPCSSVSSFKRMLARHKPCLVLLNRSLAGSLGFKAAGSLSHLPSGIPAMTYCPHVDGNQMFISPPGGASGYLLKRVKPDRLLDPVIMALRRSEMQSEEMLLRVKYYFQGILQLPSTHDSSVVADLTPRERVVMELMCTGCVDKEIARAMNISPWTVHGHIKKIFERLKVRTRTEAVVRYLEK